jgi:hypothetical protein
VLKYDSASNGATDYRALAREVATMRAWPTGLDRTGTPLPPVKSLVERAIDAADRTSDRAEVRPEVRPEATVNPSLDATRLTAARVGGAATTTPPAPAPQKLSS